MSRPLIPKNFAAKITRAQAAVKDKRQAIAYGERERDQLKEQEAMLYSKLLSGDLSDHVYRLKIDSTRRKQERELERHPQRYVELDELEINLAALEVEMLRKVLAMRPSEGRVRWPRSLPPFEQTVRKYVSDLAEVDRISREKHQRLMAQLKVQDENACEAMENALTKLAESLAKAVRRGAMTEDAALTFIRTR